MKKQIAVILGPTATGKSHCGIALAQALDGEIISGDSMLVYRGMDIGTAKPTAEELALVPHHMVDILPPEADSALRAELEALLAEQGKEALYARLIKSAPAEAGKIDINNTRRVIRAIEAAESGDDLSHSKSEELVYDAAVFGLRMERSVLYERINRRVDIMLEQGLIEETRLLLEEGVPETAQSMQAIGYRQTVLYLKGEWDKATAVDKIKQATRNFAKRQFTWYKKMPYVKWFNLDAEPNYENVTAEMIKTVVEKFKIG